MDKHIGQEIASQIRRDLIPQIAKDAAAQAFKELTDKGLVETGLRNLNVNESLRYLRDPGTSKSPLREDALPTSRPLSALSGFIDLALTPEVSSRKSGLEKP